MNRDEKMEQLLIAENVAVVRQAVEGYSGLLIRKGEIALAFVNNQLDRRKMAAILAEELGHILTSMGDTVRISDQRKIGRAEERAIRKAIAILISPEDVITAILSGIRNWYDLSEQLDLPEDFLRKAVDVWKLTIGPCYVSGSNILWFDPLELYR
jgi:hypothetical protein